MSAVVTRCSLLLPLALPLRGIFLSHPHPVPSTPHPLSRCILNAVEFRIEVLGPFKLVNLRDGNPIYLRSNARLLAHLAIQAPRPIRRHDLILTLWPGEDNKVTSNRLRVALTKLRQLLPGLVIESRDGLTLDPAIVDCDAQIFRGMVEDACDTSREQDEFDGLHEATRYFCRNVRALGFQSWPLEELKEPVEAYYRACTRLADLGLRLRRNGTVSEVCSRALLLWPRDPLLWKAFLEARINLGQGEAAVREISATKDRGLLNHKEVRPVIDRVLKGEPDEQGAAIRMSGSESQLAAEILKVMITSRQDTARLILSSPETLTLAGAQPREMLSLLERVVAEPAIGDENWERCMARIVGLKAWLSDTQGVFEYGHRLVETCTRPLFLRAVWNAIALAHALRREWPEATSAIETTIRYAGETGNEIDLLSAQGNRAFFLWHQGHYMEADAEYERTLGLIKALGTEQSEFEYEMGSGNRAFIPMMQGDWPEALRRMEACYEVRTRGPRKISLGLILPGLALCRMMTGQKDEVLPMLRQGFFDANTAESEQYQQITFEFGACILACTEHKGFARSVVDWVEAWRGRAGLPRSYAERELLRRVFAGVEPDGELGAEASPIVGRALLGRLRKSL